VISVRFVLKIKHAFSLSFKRTNVSDMCTSVYYNYYSILIAETEDYESKKYMKINLNLIHNL